ncbi:glycosyltransferase family 2 protein [Leptospira interrogans]
MKDMLAETDPVPRSDASPLPITAVILTHNEEIHISRCLTNALQVAQRVIVVDSFSTDRTVEIALQFGAEIHQRKFKNQADQLQWTLDNCDFGTGWILRLDADEYLEPSLIEEIRAKLTDLPSDVAGVNLKRKLIFRGRWIQFGGYYPTILLRLWRVGAADVPPAWMDEHTVLKLGRCVTFSHDFCDHNLKDITAWTEKHNRYATRKMADFIAMNYSADSGRSIAAVPDRRWKHFLQHTVFRRCPLYLRSILYFLYRYFLRLGFLDGGDGLVWHGLQGFWYHLLIDTKIAEARTHIRAHGIESFRVHLKQRHGIELP